MKEKKLIENLNACLAESDGKTPITDAVIVAIRCAVEQMPEVDAVPVVHGEWIKKYDGIFDCSSCGVRMDLAGTPEEYLMHYCPNCGAKMDGGSK